MFGKKKQADAQGEQLLGALVAALVEINQTLTRMDERLAKLDDIHRIYESMNVK